MYTILIKPFTSIEGCNHHFPVLISGILDIVKEYSIQPNPSSFDKS
jgi:hypothetical protein